VVDGVVFSEVDRQVAHGIEDGHIEFIVLLGTQTGCPEFGNEGRTAADRYGQKSGASESSPAGVSSA
jgi:hypothetical protein